MLNTAETRKLFSDGARVDLDHSMVDRVSMGDELQSSFDQYTSPAGSERMDSWSSAGGVYRDFGKRIFDFVASAILLIMLLPLFLFIAIGVALDGGPVFFSHRRIGKDGRTFLCHKFRSMVTDAEARLADCLARDPTAAREWARDHKLTNDPRITRWGAFLRQTSLDELPQLVNVIRGDMSLVGPRPVTKAELSRYGWRSHRYLAVKPGVTGLWQVSGRNDLDYGERVRLDVRYAETVTLHGDVVILLRTVLAVLKMTGR
jgi:lipopolysaccharide/colanic/teichoic acid biosynthesis glycosyltransferase